VEEDRPVLSIPPSQVSVLLVDDDPLLCSSLRRALERQGYSVHVAASADEAMAVIQRAHVDVLLTDLMLGEKDGMDLIREARRIAPDMRPILMSGHASAKDHECATQLGAVRVLVKPFSPIELQDAIRQAIDCEVGFRGSVHGLSLVDMLQMFHYGRRSVSIHVNGGAIGTIHMRKGEFVHARAGALAGREALRMLLSGASGSVRTSALETAAQTLEGSFESLLLDSLRELDETSHRGADLEEMDFGRVDPLTDALAAVIRKEVPGARAWLVGAGEAARLVGEADDACDAGSVARVIVSMTRLVPDWSAFEVVMRESSLGVLRRDETHVIVVWMDTSQTRAVERFRSHFAKFSRLMLQASSLSEA
jgi:DNA-binding response OmpR family regulator